MGRDDVSQGRKKKFTVRIEGRVLARVSASREYRYVVLARRDEAAHLETARNPAPTEADRKNAAYFAFVAACEPGVGYPLGGLQVFYSAADVKSAKGRIEGGEEAFFARLREERIGAHEVAVRMGRFLPFAVRWCMGLSGAEQGLAEARRYGLLGARYVSVGTTIEKWED
jgi:hypothetical protein